MKTTKSTYRKDKFYSKVTKAVHELLKRGDVITPIDVFIEMDKLAPNDVEAWRACRIAHLEHVVHGNLSHCSRILRILALHAADRGLKPSRTDYRAWGKKNHKRPLRFTRHGHPHAEQLWSTHYLRDSKRKPDAPPLPPRRRHGRPRLLLAQAPRNSIPGSLLSYHRMKTPTPSPTTTARSPSDLPRVASRHHHRSRRSAKEM